MAPRRLWSAIPKALHRPSLAWVLFLSGMMRTWVSSHLWVPASHQIPSILKICTRQKSGIVLLRTIFTQSEAPTGKLTKRRFWLILHAHKVLRTNSTTMEAWKTIQFKQWLLMLRPHWPVDSRSTPMIGLNLRASQISTQRQTSWTLPWCRKWRSPCTWGSLMILAPLLPQSGCISKWALPPSRTGLLLLGKATFLGASRQAIGSLTIWPLPCVLISEEG